MEAIEEIRLTSFSHGAGCACKVGPGLLEEIMSGFEAVIDPALLVGTTTGDDAAVYRIDERTALVFTVDFFTPIVDDPYDWGRIAATNALSDVYAMGGRPILCLNIAAWPVDDLPASMLRRVLEGGASVAKEAGAFVAGGHTIDDKEPKYGMAVAGLADPNKIIRNDRAKAGDRLVLTKPLGLGVISTAIKRGIATPDAVRKAVDTMTTLNAAASRVALDSGIVAGTDVTGFGLLGHLHKMCFASGTSASVHARNVRFLPQAMELAQQGIVPGGTKRNLAYVEPWVTSHVSSEMLTLLADAQTSGGLLLCVQADRVQAVISALEGLGIRASEIGSVRDGDAGHIEIDAS